MSPPPAPPPRRSSWSWMGLGRRNSLSLGDKPAVAPAALAAPAPNPRPHPPLRQGRNSLSALDSNMAKSIRAEILDSRHTDPDVAKNNRRSSSSRPPPAYYNRPYTHHQRASSSTAVLQRPSSSHEDVLLKPPNRSRPPSSPSPVVATSAGAPFVPVVPVALVVPVRETMPLAMLPPRDQEMTARAQSASARVQQVMSGQAGGLKASNTDRTAMNNMIPTPYPPSPQRLERPDPYNRPRRQSNSSVSSVGSSVVWGRESFESRHRSSSINSSQTSFESMSPYSPGPGSYAQYQMKGYPWHRPAPIKVRKRAKPGELFSLLPGEVLELILQELRKLHVQPGSSSCETCWMRDCSSVALSARKFIKYAREALYQHVHLVGSDGPLMKKRTKLNYGSRLVLLRRTLRANQHIAVIVRSLKPPALPTGASVVEYNDLVASVVMACPNLERLVGFYPTYDHQFQRLFHALSTRKRLKEMKWMVEASSFQRQHKLRPSHSQHPHLWAPGDLAPHQSQDFLDFHWNWQQLTTVVIHCQPGATLTPDSLLERAFQCLPSLQDVHLSHLPHTAFNDNTLLSLPSLKRLSLSHLTGVSSGGLSSFARRATSASLVSLTLIHMNVETLPALVRLFSNLTSLETFNLVQAYAPIMPTDEFIWLFPYLASNTLHKLHWDIPYLPTRATMADNILAKSISAGGFPALRILRAPNDPEGIFQALCRPRERADYPTDRYRGGQNWHSGHGRAGSGYSHTPSHSHSNSSAAHTRNVSTATTGTNGSHPAAISPTSPLFPPDALMLPRDNSNLHQARLAAQARIEAARRFPRFAMNLVDPEGLVVEKFGVGAFIGTVESNIHYMLSADAGATDEGGGLVSVSNMVGDCGEALILGGATDGEKTRERRGSGFTGRKSIKKDKGAESEGDGGEKRSREGCVGRWNANIGALSDKKDKEKWWHTERGRWRGVSLS